MTAIHINDRVRKHRDALHAAGLRPVQLWVPDTRRPDFDLECRRQRILARQADKKDSEIQQLMGEAAADLDGWTD